MLSTVMGILFEVGKKVVELHQSGADKPILDAIHDIMHKAHGEVSVHHENHLVSNGETTEASDE